MIALSAGVAEVVVVGTEVEVAEVTFLARAPVAGFAVIAFGAASTPVGVIPLSRDAPSTARAVVSLGASEAASAIGVEKAVAYVEVPVEDPAAEGARGKSYSG